MQRHYIHNVVDLFYVHAYMTISGVVLKIPFGFIFYF